MGNDQSTVSRPSSQHRSSSNDVVQATATATSTSTPNGTRVGTIQQQASFRRSSMTIPRPPLGEIKLSDNRTSPPAATSAPTSRPPQPTPRPSWQRAPPTTPAPPRPAVTVTQASRAPSDGSDLGDRKSKWHSHPAVDVVRLVAAGMVRMRSKDSTKSTETRPLLSQASPQTPAQGPAPAAQPSSPSLRAVASPLPSPPAVRTPPATDKPNSTHDKIPGPAGPVSPKLSALAPVKEDECDPSKELWKPVVAQIDEKAALMGSDVQTPVGELAERPVPSAPEQSSLVDPLQPKEAAPEYDDVISVEDALRDAMAIDEETANHPQPVLVVEEAATVVVPPATDNMTEQETVAHAEDTLAAPEASRSITFDNRNVEDSQYPRSFAPVEDPVRIQTPSRFATADIDSRPYFDDPFGGELLPSPSDSTGHTVATPSPRSHTRDITLVAGADEPSLDSLPDEAKITNLNHVEISAPIPIPVTFEPASLPSVHLFDEIMADHAVPEVPVDNTDTIEYHASPPAAQAAVEALNLRLGLDTVLPRSPSADPYALRNIQQHSPLPRRATMSGWHMTPVRSRSPEPTPPSQPLSPQVEAATVETAQIEQDAIPVVDTFEVEDIAVVATDISPPRASTSLLPLFRPSTADLKEGCYQLRHISTNKVMDLSGNDHKSVLGWDLHGSANQLWNVRRLGKGFSLTSVANDSSISIEEGLHVGATVSTSDYPLAWKIEPFAHDEEGAFKISWPNKNLVIGLQETDASIRLYEDTESSLSQLWQLLRREESASPSIDPATNPLEVTLDSHAQELSRTIVKTSVRRDGQVIDEVEHRPNTIRRPHIRGEAWEETTTTTTTTTVTTITTTTRPRPA